MNATSADFADDDPSHVRDGHPEAKYSAKDVDKAFRDDFVHDDKHGVVKVGGYRWGQVGKDAEGAMDATSTDFDDHDSDYIVNDDSMYGDDAAAKRPKHDYGNGVAARLCWRPPTFHEGNGTGDEFHEHVFAPTDARCPSECPFTQVLAGENCYKACVQAEYCSALHPYNIFGDRASMKCSPTCGEDQKFHVVGCTECSSPGKCSKCNRWRRLSSDGTECKDYWRYLWSALNWIAIILAVIVAGFLIYLQCRPIVSPVVLKRAQIHRELCKPWRFSDPLNFQIRRAVRSTEAEKYPLSTWTHAEDVSGVSVMLYFRWIHLMLFFSIVLLAILYLTFHVSLESVTDR